MLGRQCHFGFGINRMEILMNKDNNFDFSSMLFSAPQNPTPSPFSNVAIPAAPSPRPSLSLADLMRGLSQPPKPKPPALSVEHMNQILTESLNKKLEVNPGRRLPTIFDLAIGEGRKLNAAFAYTDLDGYSKLISSQGTGTGFKLLQAFVTLVEKITAHFNGAVVDCAGDRTLSVFFRSSEDNSAGPIKEALTAALWIQTAMHKVVAPRFRAAQVQQVSASIGIDYGSAIAGCVGVRGNKRIVFFGDAANTAAKLQEQGAGGETVVSPLAFQHRPSYLNNGTWRFDQEYDFVQRTVKWYKTAYLFVDDLPVDKQIYLK